jgi:tetratricopeptide (TPR) repeat protein
MKPQGPRLDQHGFPIPAGFDDRDDDLPGSGGSWARGGRLRGLLKLAVVAAILGALAVHFDVGTKARDLFGQYHAQQAIDSYRRNDLEGALAEADRAVGWNPQSVQYLVLRAHLYNEKKDFAHVLDDAERALALKPNDDDAQQLRASALHYLQRHRESAAAATDMLQRGIGNRAGVLNSRAYARALGNFELNEALADIDEALAGDVDNPSFLDTRAYVLFKLGRNDEAMKEFTRAIEMVEKQRDQWELQARKMPQAVNSEEQIKRRLKVFQHDLAVMHHHRGEVHEKLGHEKEAKNDLFIGKQLGFDPANGVY